MLTELEGWADELPSRQTGCVARIWGLPGRGGGVRLAGLTQFHRPGASTGLEPQLSPRASGGLGPGAIPG